MSSQVVKSMTLKNVYKSHESAMNKLEALQEANRRRQVAAKVRKQLPGLIQLFSSKRLK